MNDVECIDALDAATTNKPRSSRYGQGWAELQRQQAHVKAYEGFLNAAVAGAIVWALLGGVFVILWGVMS